MPKHAKVKFGPTVPASGGKGHSHSHSSHSSSSSKAAPVDPGSDWGTTGG